MSAGRPALVPWEEEEEEEEEEEGRGREEWGGTTTWEQSATDIRGSAIRHSCSAMSTSFGEGLRETQRDCAHDSTAQ